MSLSLFIILINESHWNVNFGVATRGGIISAKTVLESKVTAHSLKFIDYCKEHNVEPSGMSKMINKSLKERLEVNAMDLRLLKERTGKLPL